MKNISAIVMGILILSCFKLSVAQQFSIDTLTHFINTQPSLDEMQKIIGQQAKPYYDESNRQKYLFFDTKDEQWEFGFLHDLRLSFIRYLNKTNPNSLPEFDVKWFEARMDIANEKDIYEKFGNPRSLNFGQAISTFEYQAGDLYYSIATFPHKGLSQVSYENRAPQPLTFEHFNWLHNSYNALSKSQIFDTLKQPSKVYLQNKKAHWYYKLEEDFGNGSFDFIFDTLQQERLKEWSGFFQFRKSEPMFDTTLVGNIKIEKQSAVDIINMFDIPNSIRLTQNGELWMYEGTINGARLELHFDTNKILKGYLYNIYRNGEDVVIRQPEPAKE